MFRDALYTSRSLDRFRLLTMNCVRRTPRVVSKLEARNTASICRCRYVVLELKYRLGRQTCKRDARYCIHNVTFLLISALPRKKTHLFRNLCAGANTEANTMCPTCREKRNITTGTVQRRATMGMHTIEKYIVDENLVLRSLYPPVKKMESFFLSKAL